MNKKFNELPGPDRLNVINAALQVFSQLDYKSASTGLIAQKAQISDELLLDYFHSKSELYLFLHQYCTNFLCEQIKKHEIIEITDFFELLRHMLCREYQLPAECPFFISFILKSLTADRESVSEEIETTLIASQQSLYKQYFDHIDTESLQDGVDCFSIVKMILCMTCSYVHNSHLQNKKLSREKLGAQFDLWTASLRSVVYK